MRSPHPHRLEQAPVPAVDVDGVKVVSVGTVIFALACVVAALAYDELAAAGRGWWLSVLISGFGLGLLGVAYCWRRQHRRETGPSAVTDRSSPDH